MKPEDFGEYIRQVKPSELESVAAWQTAIGLQQVDGQKPSQYIDLLLGEQWDLRNRFLHINPPAEWRVQQNLAAPEQVPEQVPEQATEQDLLHANNQLIIELINTIGNEELSISQLMEKVGLKHRPNFIEYHLNPAISEGYIRLLYPQSPRHPRQKYLLTVKGLALYNELKK